MATERYDCEEVEQISLTHNCEISSAKMEPSWYRRKTLVREVFYVQTVMIFTVIIASPDIGKKIREYDPVITNTSGSSDRKSNLSSTFHKRTIQHREIFYAQTLMVYIFIITSIVNLKK